MPLSTPLLDTIAQIQSARSKRVVSAPPVGFSLPRQGSTGGFNGSNDPRVNAILSYAKTKIGIPYKWGGTTDAGYDCSGYVQKVYGKFGIHLPRTSRQQAAYGAPISASQARAGDLVYYGTGSGVHHIGIYLGGGQYIEAPHTGDRIKIASIGSHIGGFSRVLH